MHLIPTVLAYLIGRFGERAVKIGLVTAVYGLLNILAFTFFVTLFSVILQMYVITQDLLDSFSSLVSMGGSNSSNCLMQSISVTFTRLGIIDAWNSSKSAFFTALIFSYTVVLYRIVFAIGQYYVKQLDSYFIALK